MGLNFTIERGSLGLKKIPPLLALKKWIHFCVIILVLRVKFIKDARVK